MQKIKPTMFSCVESSSEAQNVDSLRHFKSIRASEVKIKNQTYLWDAYIPFKTSCLFAGPGGIGKSTLLCYLAAKVSSGFMFSVNALDHKIPKGKVILLSAEDSTITSVVPRLKANDANLSNIEIIESTIDANSKEIERFVALDTDLDILEAKIKELNQEGDRVILIIIDPITAYIGNVKDNKATEVRNFILKINKIAEKYDIAIILNTHTRKKNDKSSSGGTAADEVMGSSAWYNTVRQAFSIARHHDDQDLILFISSKSNCGKKPEGLSYRLEQVKLSEIEEEVDTSRIIWQNGKVTMTADEAVHQGNYDNKLEIDAAKEFILDTLSFGSKSYEEIRQRAEKDGININTLKKARQILNNTDTPIVMEKSHTDSRKMIWYIGNSTK